MITMDDCLIYQPRKSYKADWAEIMLENDYERRSIL